MSLIKPRSRAHREVGGRHARACATRLRLLAACPSDGPRSVVRGSLSASTPALLRLPPSTTTMCAFITPCVSFGAAAPAARLAAAGRRHQAAAAAGGQSRRAARPSPPPVVMETISFEKIDDVLDTPTSKIAKYSLTLRVAGSTSSLVRKETVASAKKTIKAPGFRPGAIPPFMRASIQEFILTECLQVRFLWGGRRVGGLWVGASC